MRIRTEESRSDSTKYLRNHVLWASYERISLSKIIDLCVNIPDQRQLTVSIKAEREMVGEDRFERGNLVPSR